MIGWGLLFVQPLHHHNRMRLAATVQQQQSAQLKEEGIDLNEQGKFHEALAKLKEAIELDPSNAEAWYEYGCTIAYTEGPGEEQIQAYEKCLALEPAPNVVAGIHNNWGVYLVRMQDYDGAAEKFKMACDANPDYATAHVNYANLLALSGSDDEEAVSLYERAIDLDPSVWSSHYMYGNLLYRLDRVDDAELAFKKAMVLSSYYDADLICAYGDLLKDKRRDFDAAEKMYNMAIKVDPDHGLAKNALADLAAQRAAAATPPASDDEPPASS